MFFIQNLFLFFDKRFNEVGPRIAKLGQNKSFEQWILGIAFLNRWTALFVCDLTLEEFSSQISRLCNAKTATENKVLFRCYTPTILNEWLDVLQQESLLEQAIGYCTDIFYIPPVPDCFVHYFMKNNQFKKEEIPLCCEKTSISHSQPMEYRNENQSENWFLSDLQLHSLIIARANYFVQKIYMSLWRNDAIREKYTAVTLSQSLIRVANICFRNQIMEENSLKTIVNLYVSNNNVWDLNEDKVNNIFSSSISNKEKLVKLSKLLNE